MKALPHFTPAEAAAVTRLPLKSVNNAIDKKTIPAQTVRRRGQPVRLVDVSALVYMRLEARLVRDTTPAFRRRLFQAIAAAQGNAAESVEVGALRVDLAGPQQEVREGIEALRRAEALAETDPDIMGGSPVFRGTRIPVHLVADLIRQGETTASLREGYPRLTEEMIQLAPVYAQAHPLRGRPGNRSSHRPAKHSKSRAGAGNPSLS
jgi:uncharacterized protein (DUF433 family)